MILNKIVLTDFGLYRGVQSIDLAPKKRRNIILFGGKNGAGKTTLLEAIKLCFYGQAWSPELGSRSRYEAYLNGRIHRNPNALLQPTSAAVEVEFQLGEISGVNLYSVKRSWTSKAGGKLVEYFVVHKNGKPLEEVSEDHWQDFVRDLIPAGISQLFFFDGEKIQHLAEDGTDQATLADSIKSLLGVDVIERLQSDLSIFRSKTAKSSSSNADGERLQELEDALQVLESETEDARKQLQSHRNTAIDLQAKINHVEDQISSLGGNFARRREELSGNKTTLKTKIAHHEETIRDLAGGLLPFCLVPELGVALKSSLEGEDAIRNTGIVRDELSKARERLILSFRTDDLAFLKPLPSTQLKAARSEFQQLVERTLTIPETRDSASIHHLSPEQGRQLTSWLDQAQGAVVPLRHAASELESAYRELQKVERDLKNAPADELIKPHFQELSNLHQQQAEANLAALNCDKRIKELGFALEEKRRILSKLAETLAAAETQAESLRRAAQIQLALDEFKTTLIERKVDQLQRYLTEAFNLLCRKKDALKGVVINPKDFSVVLLDKFDRPLQKSELSAGEKQIYAISVLWALAKTSGRPLPMIVDTPLARLDLDHRRSLAKHYFPYASQQTIILSTDTEIDQSFFQELQPNIAKSYRLDFVEEEGATAVRHGYFWSEPVEVN